MDYKSIHGPGISNFSSSSSPHRLPTVSAAQALIDLNSSGTRCISTGLRDLDALLQNRDPGTVFEGDAFFGGISRGKVTEVWGPPGVGKTVLGMQLASSVLNAGEGVVWVDASHPVPGPRFSQILTSFKPTVPQTNDPSSSPPLPRTLSDLLEGLVHFSTPTLAHLIALLTHQTTVFPPPRTSLIIIDSFSTLISNAFPRNIDSKATPKNLAGAPNPSSRKFSILQYLINSFQKFAATRNMAIVILSECVTRMRPGAGAVLVPAINTTAWEQGLGCRISLFRDWGCDDEAGNEVNDVRLAEVVKAEGIATSGGTRKLVGFTVKEIGLEPLALPIAPIQPQDPVRHHALPNQAPIETPSLLLPQKRKLSATGLEIPDSEGEDDEDYGWAEEDEEDIPPMPPQWQGSEDILVPPEAELEGEDVAIEEDEEEEEEEEEEQDKEKADEGSDVDAGLRGRDIVEDSEDELAV